MGPMRLEGAGWVGGRLRLHTRAGTDRADRRGALCGA